MDWQLTPLFLPLVTAAVVSAAMALYAWRRRAVPGALPLSLLMASLCWWTTTYACELGAQGFLAKFFWTRVRYPGIYGTALSWLALALTFGGRDRGLTPRRWAALGVVPLLTMGVVATNGMHGLFWRRIALQPDSLVLVSEHGPWFWVHFAFVYGLLLLSVVLVLLEGLRSPEARALAVPLILAVLVPWAANALHLSGRAPWGAIDATPFALSLSGLGIAFALFRLGFLDIVPVAQAAVVGSMPDAVLVLDRRGRLVELNPAAAALLTLSPEEARGRPAEELLGPWPELLKGASGPAEARGEVWLGPSPAARAYELRVAPLVWRRRVGGRVLVLRDVTEERRLERLREDLTHAMVHDLRGPLTGVAGALEFFAEHVSPRLTPRERDLLGVARSSGERLTALVDAILDVSRLESGQLPVVCEALSLGPLVAETLALHAPQAAARGLELAQEVPEGLPSVTADPALLRRVLQNLIGNGVKFARPGGRVRVVAQLDQGAPRVLVDVSDDGQGVPAELRGRLFQKFAAGPQRGCGSGLGLAFCRLALEAHGQRIWEDSGPGQGARFRFTLAAHA